MNIERIIKKCDSGMFFAICAFAFFLPISIALIESSFGAALFCFFLKRGLSFYLYLHGQSLQKAVVTPFEKIKRFFGCFKPQQNYLNGPVGIFILLGFFSIFFSQYPHLSIKGFFFKLLESTYLYFIFIECVSTKRHLRIFSGIFILSAALAVLSGIVQYLTRVDFIRFNISMDGRVTSSFVHPNDFGAYLIIIAPILLAFSIFGEKNAENRNESFFYPVVLRLFFIALFSLAFTNLGLTYSRGTWLAFIMSMIAFGAIRRRIFYIPLLVIAVFTLIFFPQLEKQRHVSIVSDDIEIDEKENVAPEQTKESVDSPLAGPIITTFRKQLNVITNFKASGRETFWKNSIKIIGKYPLGSGLNTYSRVSEEYVLAMTNFPFWSGYPHNCYLQLTAEMGITGLISFLWIICSLYRNSIRHLKLVKDPFLLSVLLGSMSGLFGFLCQSFVDTNFYTVQLGNLMWLTIGLAVSSQIITLNDKFTKADDHT